MVSAPCSLLETLGALEDIQVTENNKMDYHLMGVCLGSHTTVVMIRKLAIERRQNLMVKPHFYCCSTAPPFAAETPVRMYKCRWSDALHPEPEVILHTHVTQSGGFYYVFKGVV